MKRIFVLFLSLSLLTFLGCEKSDEFSREEDMNIIFSDNQQAIRGNIKYQYDARQIGT